MLPEGIASKKAELIHHGKIYIPKDLTLPYYPSRSTAGPGAGSRAMIFSFSGTRVKLAIVRDTPAIFSLTRKQMKDVDETAQNQQDISAETQTVERRCVSGNPYMILKNSEPFIDEVSIEPTIMHAPRQAFINITSECIYNCSFCVTPTLNKGQKECTVDRWIELILAHAKNSNLDAVAITSGVAESPHKTVLDMVQIIKAVRSKLPEMPIGVEPYINSNEDVDLLYDAGATELKINLETPKREIFDKICPGMDYEGVSKVLRYAVSIFGRNQVCSNLIVGLNESDDDIVRVVEELAKDGIVATLRALRLNEHNKPKISAALGLTPKPVEPERILQLAKSQKQILDKYWLSTTKFKTMCHRCKSCDIVPHQDI